MTDSSGTTPWEEPEFEFDDIGIDLATAARQNSGKMWQETFIVNKKVDEQPAQSTALKQMENICIKELKKIKQIYYKNEKSTKKNKRI